MCKFDRRSEFSGLPAKGFSTRSSADENGCCLPHGTNVRAVKRRQPNVGSESAFERVSAFGASKGENAADRRNACGCKNRAICPDEGVYYDRAVGNAVCQAECDCERIVRCGFLSRCRPLFLRFLPVLILDRSRKPQDKRIRDRGARRRPAACRLTTRPARSSMSRRLGPEGFAE